MIKPKTALFAYISYAVVGVAVLLLMYLSVQILRPENILDVKKQPLEVVPTSVVAGDTVDAKFDYCKYKDLTSNITINFIGDVILPSLQTQQHFPLGCHERNLKFAIPTSAPTGDYSVRFQILYRANSVHTQNYEFITVPFHVIGLKDGRVN